MKLYIPSFEANGTTNFVNMAYLDKASAENEVSELNSALGKELHFKIDEVDLPFIGSTVCYVHTFSCVSGQLMLGRTHIDNSRIYASVEDAKRDKIWSDAVDKVKQYHDRIYHITDTEIFPDDYGKSDKCECDFFTVEIKSIPVMQTNPKAT